jgi:hypothetical protein
MQPSQLDAEFLYAADQSLRPGEPTGGLRPLTGYVHEHERQPQGAAGSQGWLTALEKAGVRSRTSVNARGIFASQVSCGREAIEIVGLEARLRVRGRQPCEGVRPCASVECRPGLF